jgi:hemoglobin
MKPDITTRADIEALIDHFYGLVRADDVIGHIFNDVVKVDWPAHLPIMYDFWEYLLLGGQNYRGNPIQKHFHVHDLIPLTGEHFDRWLALFQQSVDDLFQGPKAEDAKFRAYTIAETWRVKFTGPFARK